MSWSEQGYFATQFSAGKPVWNTEFGNTDTSSARYDELMGYSEYQGGREVAGAPPLAEIRYGASCREYFRGRVEGEHSLEELKKLLEPFNGLPVFLSKCGGIERFNSQEDWELKHEAGATLFVAKAVFSEEGEGAFAL